MTEPCVHEQIQTYRFEDGAAAGLWSCVACGRRFEPLNLAAAPLQGEPAGRIKLPTNRAEAEGMAKLGLLWLEQNPKARP